MTIQLLDNVLNPEPIGLTMNKGVFAGPEITKESLAKRLQMLDGKTVYLIDIGYGGSYKFMMAVQRWFEKNMPSVKTVRKRTRAHSSQKKTQRCGMKSKPTGTPPSSGWRAESAVCQQLLAPA